MTAAEQQNRIDIADGEHSPNEQVEFVDSGTRDRRRFRSVRRSLFVDYPPPQSDRELANISRRRFVVTQCNAFFITLISAVGSVFTYLLVRSENNLTLLEKVLNVTINKLSEAGILLDDDI